VLGLGRLLAKVTEFIQAEAMSRDRNIVIVAYMNKSGSTTYYGRRLGPSRVWLKK